MKVPSEQNSQVIYPSVTDELMTKIVQNDESLTNLNILTSTDESVEKLVKGMRSNTVIKKLILHGSHNAKDRCLGCTLVAGKNVGHLGVLTNISARRLAECTSLISLDLNCNNIDDEGLRALAQSNSLRKLSMIGCPITENGINFLLQNQSIEDFKYLNRSSTVSHRTRSLLEDHLSRNRGSNNPAEQKNLERKRVRAETEERLQRVIKHKGEDIGNILVDNQMGVDEKMEYGCNALQLAVDEEQNETAVSLLRMGAKIETVERGYTPLFTAAESGKQSTSSALLSYGASLAGGFDFNPETPISIAGFKFCEALFKHISHCEIECILDLEDVDDQKFRLMCLRNKNQKPYSKPWYLNYNALRDVWHLCCVDSITIEEQNQPVVRSFTAVNRREATNFPHFPWLNMSPVFIKKIIQFIADMDNLWTNGGAPWIDFARVPKYLDTVIVEAMTIYRQMRKHLPDDQTLAQLDSLFQIYYEFHQKKAIATSANKFYKAPARPLSSRSVTIMPPVSTKVQKKLLGKAELKCQLDLLNDDIKQHGFNAIDWSKYPMLYVADYRAIHYYQLYFTEAQREDHSATHQLNRIAPATAVFSMEGKTPAEHVLMSEEVVDTDRQIILRTFNEFQEEGIEDDLHARMANDYEGYNNYTNQSGELPAKILREKKILKYPYYAASELPEHPLRYGYGQKPIKGLSASRLRANYDASGKPANPTLGKIYGALYTPAQIFSHQKRSAIGKHNAGKMPLREQVAPEREVDVPGGAQSEVLFYEEVLTVPDFSQPYQPDYLQVYGLSANRFAAIMRDFSQRSNTNTHGFSEELIKELIQYKRKDLIRKAQAEAQRRGGYLIYWDGDKTFSLEPPPVRPSAHLYQYEREMLSVGEERFERTGMSNRK